MNTERVDMWFMPFEESHDPPMLDPTSELSSYSSVRMSPTLSEYDARTESYYPNSCVPETSPSDIASEMIMDDMSVSDRRASTGEKSQTSSRRRAQNRAAQRAFRERKEKRARDLEEQLAMMTEKYKDLEMEHVHLQQSHEKLQQTLELLTCDDDGRTSGEQLRRFLDIIQGKAKTKLKRDMM